MGWDDLLKKEIATYSSILAWEILWTREPVPEGLRKSWAQLSD